MYKPKPVYSDSSLVTSPLIVFYFVDLQGFFSLNLEYLLMKCELDEYVEGVSSSPTDTVPVPTGAGRVGSEGIRFPAKQFD